LAGAMAAKIAKLGGVTKENLGMENDVAAIA
jgi:hypothetical protein